LFVSRKLTRDLLGQIADAGFTGVEIFCSRAHFDYTSKTEARDIGGMLASLGLTLTSLHAPTSRDLSATRESGQPLSICEVERVRRIEAMDELKRAIDIAEDLPFPRMIFHMGGTRETADPRKRDAAFSSLEHLILHAKHVGVTICVENTTSEMGEPAYLRSFYDETRLTGLRFNFDIGHAFLARALGGTVHSRSIIPGDGFEGRVIRSGKSQLDFPGMSGFDRHGQFARTNGVQILAEVEIDDKTYCGFGRTEIADLACFRLVGPGRHGGPADALFRHGEA